MPRCLRTDIAACHKLFEADMHSAGKQELYGNNECTNGPHRSMATAQMNAAARLSIVQSTGTAAGTETPRLTEGR